MTKDLLASSKMPTMIELKSWLDGQGLTVGDLAQELDVPLKTVQGWVDGGAAPSMENQDRLTEYILATCAHHWVIEASNGPLSGGVCRKCGQSREFQNSVDTLAWPISQRRRRIS